MALQVKGEINKCNISLTFIECHIYLDVPSGGNSLERFSSFCVLDIDILLFSLLNHLFFGFSGVLFSERFSFELLLAEGKSDMQWSTGISFLRLVKEQSKLKLFLTASTQASNNKQRNTCKLHSFRDVLTSKSRHLLM